MKSISILLTLIAFFQIGHSQIKGNKDIKTITVDLESFETIKINLYAKVNIDQTSAPKFELTTDSNLFEFIDMEVVDGTLYLDQKEWISPSQDIRIDIGAPELTRVETGTHDVTTIKVNTQTFSILAPIGTIQISGKTDLLSLGVEMGKVDASKLDAKDVTVNLWGRGEVKVNPVESLSGEVSENGRLFYTTKPPKFNLKSKNGSRIDLVSNVKKVVNPEARFIKFKIRNNSGNRRHFVVVGPKPDGSSFSYGFPMMPFSSRKENWSIGTKVYVKNAVGLRKLILTISEENENQLVDLF